VRCGPGLSRSAETSTVGAKRLAERVVVHGGDDGTRCGLFGLARGLRVTGRRRRCVVAACNDNSERMLPSQYPETQPYPALRRLLEIQLDMQVADLKTLLCLPREEEGLGAGCNLTAATLAVNLIAGASVLFWRSSVEALAKRGDRTKRFNDLMVALYPWSHDDAVNAELGAKLLWDYTRNPLSHTLGIGQATTLLPGMPQEERGVRLAKSALGLSPEQVDELMGTYERPVWVGPTVTTDGSQYTVRVLALAWGLHRLLRDLFADAEQASKAEATAQALLGE
jgi:hypothetical protein